MTEPSMFEGLDLDFDLRLKLIKAFAEALPTVEQVEQSGDPVQEMAQLMVGNSGYQILNRELNYLAADMGVDLKTDASPAEKLAEVIELFDGNRRRHRL